MKPRSRQFALYVAFCLLVGCTTNAVNWQADAGPGGIGGTGVIQDDQTGIGGTGKQIDEGIGGTGRVAHSGDGGSGIGGTGIVGTITGFGSIWVNDAHVHFDDTTPITINQAPATSGELQLGQVVAVDSIADGDAFQAKSIDIIHEVVGPIDSIELSAQRLQVLNQDVMVDDSTVFYSALSETEFSAEELSDGVFVEVSGLRQSDGDIVASRIDLIEAPQQLQLIGELEQNDHGQWQINDQIVEIDELLMPDEFDKRVLISGHLEGDFLIAEALGLDSIETVLEDASELIYEGYFYEEGIDGYITVGGLEFAIEDAIEFSEEHDFDEPLRVNAFMSEEGHYEASDLLVELEHGDHYFDLIPEFEDDHDYEFEGEWEEEDYFEEEYHHEEDFEDDYEEDYDDEYFDDDFEEDFEDEYWEEEYEEEY